MLITVVESKSSKYYIGEPFFVMKAGEWEKTMFETHYSGNSASDNFTGFEVLESEDKKLKTSLFCLQTKKTEQGVITNQKCIIAVIPDTFWDINKMAKAKEHGFFIETNGKIPPKLNPNKNHISICYTGSDNKTYTYTILTQLKRYEKYAKKLSEKRVKFQTKTNKASI